MDLTIYFIVLNNEPLQFKVAMLDIDRNPGCERNVLARMRSERTLRSAGMPGTGQRLRCFAGIGPGFLFVDLAPVCNSRHAHHFRRVVDDVHYAPITHAHVPLIFVALQLFASCWPWNVAQSFEFADNASQHAIRQRFEFLPGGWHYLDSVAIHAADGALRGPL